MAETTHNAEDGAFDPRELRNALGRFATGITVITTAVPGGGTEALTANSFAALSLDPPLVLWSLINEAPSRQGFLDAGCFVINVLGSHQRAVSNQFARPGADKFGDIAWHPGIGGCPILDDNLAVFECSTERTVDGGDHLLFIGRVERFAYRDGNPLIFSGGRYCLAAEMPADTDDVGIDGLPDLLRWI